MAELAPRRFRLVVFDWDGTLADSTALIAEAIRCACGAVGRPMPSEDALLLATSQQISSRTGTPDPVPSASV